MTRTQIGMVVALLMCLAGTGADSLLKAASLQKDPFLSRLFFAGIALSILFACAWLVLMRYMKLATAGAIYAVVSALMLAVIGVVFFDERLTPIECTGIVMGAASVALLTRFVV